jgi:hypothetical protein
MLPPSTLGCDESPCFKGIIGCFNPMMPPSTLGCEELSFQGQRWVFSPNVALVTLGCEELPHFKGDIGCVRLSTAFYPILLQIVTYLHKLGFFSPI